MTSTILNRKAKCDYYDPTTWEVFLRVGQVIDQAAIDRLDIYGLLAAEVAQHGGRPAAVPLDEWRATARYKSATARVLLRLSERPVFRVNGQPVPGAFAPARPDTRKFLDRLCNHETVSGILANKEIIVNVVGGQPGSDRHVKATAHALARALATYDPGLRAMLKRMGYWGASADPSLADDTED